MLHVWSWSTAYNCIGYSYDNMHEKFWQNMTWNQNEQECDIMVSKLLQCCRIDLCWNIISSWTSYKQLLPMKFPLNPHNYMCVWGGGGGVIEQQKSAAVLVSCFTWCQPFELNSGIIALGVPAEGSVSQVSLEALSLDGYPPWRPAQDHLGPHRVEQHACMSIAPSFSCQLC